jgi:hypothetical protein
VNNYAGITTFAVLYSTAETFIYYIQSEDHIITDDEARLVAEIEALVPISDLVGYDGSLDIYNQTGVVTPIYPKAATLLASVDGTLTASGRMKDSDILLTVTLDGSPSGGDVIEIFDGSTLITSIATVAGTLSYTYTHSFTAPDSGDEKVLNYRAVSKSSQDFASASETVSLIYDNQAPEIVSVSVGGDSKLSVTINGSGISTDEKATVLLKDGTSTISFDLVDSSGSTAELTVPENFTGTVEVVDATGNSAADATKVFSFTNVGDTITVSEAGSITFGLAGNDFITGTSGSDIISGGVGDDVIIGAGGADVLSGGEGGDIFRYLSSSDSGVAWGAFDTIIDFDFSDGDRIDLSSAINSTNSAITDLGKFEITNLYVDPRVEIPAGQERLDDARLDAEASFDQGYAAATTAMANNDAKVIFFFNDGADGYLVIDQDVDGAVPDMVIKLSGLTDVLDSAAFIL